MVEDLEGEIWRNVLDSTYYAVSNLGRVKRLEHNTIRHFNDSRTQHVILNEKLIKPNLDNKGYLHVDITLQNGARKGYLVHRLVCLAFLPNPETKSQVNRINGIKTDNKAENLEWVTAAENIHHFQTADCFIDERAGLSKIHSALMSEETRRKLSIAHTGKKLSEEHKKHISETLCRRELSDEAKLHITQANRDEVKRAKVSQKMKGRPLSREHLAKVVASNKSEKRHNEVREQWLGTHHSEETRKNMSETAKKLPPRMWITDRVSNKQVLTAEEIPVGWKRGRTATSSGFIVINNGQHEKQISGDDLSYYLSEAIQKVEWLVYVTNGVKQTLISATQLVPEG
jgi:hypothetical protein